MLDLNQIGNVTCNSSVRLWCGRELAEIFAILRLTHWNLKKNLKLYNQNTYIFFTPCVFAVMTVCRPRLVRRRLGDRRLGDLRRWRRGGVWRGGELDEMFARLPLN